MSDQPGEWWFAAGVIALAALVLAVLVRRGCLHRDAMAPGPDRIAAMRQQLREGHIIDAGLAALGLVPRGLGRETRDGLRGVAAAVPLVMGVLAVTSLLGALLGMPAPAVGHQVLDEILRSDDAARLLELVVMAVVIAPLMEELIFRGLMQTLLLAIFGVAGRWPIVVIAGIAFAMIHAGAATFGAEGGTGVPWHALPGLAVLGVMLGWLYERTGSLWPAVVAHAGFNASNIGMVLLMQRVGWLG